jgi:hypothetical protein
MIMIEQLRKRAIKPTAILALGLSIGGLCGYKALEIDHDTQTIDVDVLCPSDEGAVVDNPGIDNFNGYDQMEVSCATYDSEGNEVYSAPLGFRTLRHAQHPMPGISQLSFTYRPLQKGKYFDGPAVQDYTHADRFSGIPKTEGVVELNYAGSQPKIGEIQPASPQQ